MNEPTLNTVICIILAAISFNSVLVFHQLSVVEDLLRHPPQQQVTQFDNQQANEFLHDTHNKQVEITNHDAKATDPKYWTP